MTEQLFAFDERNYHECQTTFRGENNQEYYLGDYTIDVGSTVDVRADKKAVGAYSIIRLQSKSRLLFRRNWSHIREDATDVTVLWFVRRGSLVISHQCGTSVANAGHFGIVRSIFPFSIECRTDDQSMHEVLHVVIPSHIFRRFMPDEVNIGFCTSMERREFQIAERMFTDVFEDSGDLTTRVEQAMVDTALYVLTDGIKHCDNSMHERQSLSQKRRQDVLRYVEIHLADPKLNAEMVAQACGISRRYLSHLLRQNGTTFPNLIWDWRLKTAHEWLSSDVGNSISIAEVAFRIGFKSPAHFSRLFKRVYKMSPREYRTTKMVKKAHSESKEFYVSGSNSIQ